MKNSEEEKKGQTTENDLNFYLYTNIYILCFGHFFFDDEINTVS